MATLAPNEAEVALMDYATLILLLPLVVFMVFEDWKDARVANAKTDLVNELH